MLSRAEKEVLLKTVAQTIPNYIMGLFLLPNELCEDIEKMMNAYLWDTGSNSRGVHCMSWNILCEQKTKGGFGFRKLEDFNIALLMRQGWRIMTQPSCLIARILKARYFRDSSFLQATMNSNPTYMWSILAVQDLLRRDCRWNVSLGTNIKVWGDRRLLNESNPCVETMVLAGKEEMRVAELVVGRD